MLCSQEPGGKDPRSRRAWTQRTWLNWEPSDALMLCSQEPGGKDPRSQRAWTQRTWLEWKPSYALMLCSQEPGNRKQDLIGSLDTI